MKPVEPDAHLRAALRNAPDAGLQAPTEVGAQIIAAAHRAAGEPALRPAPTRRWWRRGMPWRMGTSGALASVLLAGVIGLMWRGEPPGPARSDPAAPATADQAAPATKAAEPATPAEVTAPAAAPTPAPVPSPAAVRTEQAARGNATEAMPAAAQAPAAAPLPAPAPAPAGRAETSATALPEAARRTADAAAVAPTAPAAPAAVQSPTPPPVPTGTAAKSLPAARMSLQAPTAHAALAAAEGDLQALPWARLGLEADAQHWRVDGQTRQVSASWLEALGLRTAGRWRADAQARPAAGALQLQWLAGDTVLGRLWLGEQIAGWCDAALHCQTAPLEPAQAADLKEKLPR